MCGKNTGNPFQNVQTAFLKEVSEYLANEEFFIVLRPRLSDGVTGNTSGFGSEESRFEP
jgi:hypothetical protein